MRALHTASSVGCLMRIARGGKRGVEGADEMGVTDPAEEETLCRDCKECASTFGVRRVGLIGDHAGTNITIVRGPNGYGFNLSRIANHHVFRFVDEAGPAFQAGARVGDSILKVNGVDAISLPHKEVATLIGTSPNGQVTLTITPLPFEVLQQAAAASGLAVGPVGTPAPKPAPASPPVTKPASPTNGDSMAPRRISIEKSAQGMGFNLARVGDQHIFRVVDPGGPAHKAGAREGYCILSVNDVNVTQLPHKDVVDLIKKSQHLVTMVVMSQPPADSQLSDAVRRASQAEEESLQLSQDRVRIEQTAVDMEHQKLTHQQQALRAEQQRVEAERGKLVAEQDRLRQEQERLRQERRQVDRAQGLVEEARAAAAAAAAEKLATEERVRRLLEEERLLKEYQLEVERLRSEVSRGTTRLAEKKKATEKLLEDIKKLASAKEISDVESMVGLVETKAVEDLKARQGPLPAEEHERVIEERRREFEQISLQEQVEDIRQQEMQKLLDFATQRKRQEEQKREESREKMRQAHFKDMQTLREKQQRLQQIMDEAMEQKRKNEEEEAARRKEEVEARKRQSQERLVQMRTEMAKEEEKKRQLQAEESLREKREQEARNALRQREEEEKRLQQQRDSTQAHMASQKRPMPTVVLAAAPPPEESKKHPMLAQVQRLDLSQGGSFLRFEKNAPNTQL